MDHLSSPSPQRDEVEQIASQMEWNDEFDVGVQLGTTRPTLVSNLRTTMALGLDKRLE
jgi:hypothetical protein